MKIPIPSVPGPSPSTQASGSSGFCCRVRRTVAPAVLAASALLLPVLTSRAEITVTMEHNEGEQATPAFHFKTVRNDLDSVLGTSLTTSLVEGEQDDNSSAPDVLFDGKGASGEDQPDQNFFFKEDADGGRLLVTLGEAIPIKEIDTYSWHTNTRAPQVYKLYASDGGEGFVAEPKRPQDPATCGWKLLASVDTRQKFGNAGGQYGVSVKNSAANLGNYRYLLFDVSRTEGDDAFGNTFYSEINVIDANSPAEKKDAPALATEEAAQGKATITININGKQETREIDLAHAGLAVTGQDKQASPSPDKAAGSPKTERTVWLGVFCEEAADDLRNPLPLTPGTGLIVRGVPPESPASKAGLQEYDVLTKLDDQLLVNVSQLTALVRGKHDGDTVKVSYLRHGQPGTAEAKLGVHDVTEGDEDAKSIMVYPNKTSGEKPAGGNLSDLVEEGTILIDKDGRTHGVAESDQIQAGRDKALRELDKALREKGVDDKSIRKIERQVANKLMDAAAKAKAHTAEKSPAGDKKEDPEDDDN